jgi:hypothetical protein
MSRGPLRLTSLAVWLVVLTVHAPPARPDGLETNPSSVNYLPIDEDVKTEIQSVNRLAAEGKWAKVVEILQRYIAKPPPTVVSLRKAVYGSPRALCEEKLRSLPERVRVHYRTTYDPQAGELYRRAREQRDIAAARRLVTEFALTSYGPRGHNLLAQFLFQKGNVDGALAHWLAWLDRVAADGLPEAERRLAAMRLGVAAALAGRPAVEARALDLFGPRGAVVRVGDARLSRREELGTLISSLRTRRNRRPPGGPAELDFSRCVRRFDDQYARRISEYHGSSHRTQFTCHAALSGRTIYVNTADGPVAIDTLTGRERWRRRARNYDSDYYGSLRSFAFHCRVYPSAARPSKEGVYVSGGGRLAAHDAETGRPLWTKTRASFARVERIGRDRNLRVAFSCPVLCHGPTGYVLMETSRAEVFLLAFDRASGDLEWCTAVGGSAPKSGYRLSFPSALLRVGSDLVFCNGRGIVGRCDAATGELRWLAPYRRRTELTQGNYYNVSEGVAYSPMVRAADVVVCVPSDGGELLAFRLGDGTAAWTRELKGAKHLLGALPPTDGAGYHRLFVASDDVMCLRSDNGNVLWRWPLPEPAGGLGWLGRARVVTATAKGVYRLDPVEGELTGFMPLPVATSESFNVVAGKHAVALVSRHSVRVLGNREQTGAAVRAEQKRHPDDPWLTASWARVLRARGESETALERLTDAVRAARKERGLADLAAGLEQEIVDLHEELRASHWAAGRRIRAFARMIEALRSPSRAPYECRLGYAREPDPDKAPPHTLVTVTGDRISGALKRIDADLLTFVVEGKAWRVARAGVRQVQLEEADGTVEAVRSELVVLKNGDRITCSVERLADGEAHLRAGFGTFRLNLSDLAVIGFGHEAEAPDEGAVYVRLRNGDEVSGSVQAFDGADLILDIPFCGRHRIGVDAIATISNRRRMPAPVPGGSNEGAADIPVLRRAF